MYSACKIDVKRQIVVICSPLSDVNLFWDMQMDDVTLDFGEEHAARRFK
jgi:hypothetical protein